MKSQCKTCPIEATLCQHKNSPSTFFDGTRNVCCTDPREKAKVILVRSSAEDFKEDYSTVEYRAIASIMYEAWLDNEITLGRIKCPGWSDPILRKEWVSCEWTGRSKSHIDPENLMEKNEVENSMKRSLKLAKVNDYWIGVPESFDNEETVIEESFSEFVVRSENETYERKQLIAAKKVLDEDIYRKAFEKYESAGVELRKTLEKTREPHWLTKEELEEISPYNFTDTINYGYPTIVSEGLHYFYTTSEYNLVHDLYGPFELEEECRKAFEEYKKDELETPHWLTTEERNNIFYSQDYNCIQNGPIVQNKNLFYFQTLKGVYGPFKTDEECRKHLAEYYANQ